jgi:hypothetical protein
MNNESKVEVCELWPYHDDRFADRHYNAWFGNCRECGAKVVVTNRVHDLLQLNRNVVSLICVQCADRQVLSN